MTDQPTKPAHFSDWAERLSSRLQSREADYLRLKHAERALEDDPEVLRVAATKTAGFALLEVIGAMRELPEFAGNVGFAPLHDLAAALSHVVDGGRPAMLQPALGKGDGSDALGRRYVKRHAVVAVRLLHLVGEKDAAARQMVAQAFTAAGFTGRKGGGVSAKTLFDWCQVTAGDADEHEQVIATVRLAQDHLADRFDTASVMSWIRWLLQQPLMQTKI